MRDFIPTEGNQGEYLDPARVLAECEAKRRIVGSYISDHLVTGNAYDLALFDVMRHLAAIYADHPDYREEWRP